MWLWIGHSNEPSGSIKGSKFLDQLSDYQFLEDILLHGVSWCRVV
jgi:hypothetical protein